MTTSDKEYIEQSLKLFWNQIEETYFRQPSKVQLLHQLAELHPFLHSAAHFGAISNKGSVLDSKTRAAPWLENQVGQDGTTRGGRRSGAHYSNPDGLQMPNRPLKRGENLLDLWDQTQARRDRQQDKKSKTKKTSAADIAALIGPQKINQWMTQFCQSESFSSYLATRFSYLDELEQDFANATSQGQQETLSRGESPIQMQNEQETPEIMSRRRRSSDIGNTHNNQPYKRQRRSTAIDNNQNEPPQLPSKMINTKVETHGKARYNIQSKRNVDSLIKDLEKDLGAVQTEVVDGFNKLERKVQCFRKPKSQLIIEQKNNCAERHLETLIVEMELMQLAESIVQVTGRVPVYSRTSHKGISQSVQSSIDKNKPYLLLEKIKHKIGGPRSSKNNSLDKRDNEQVQVATSKFPAANQRFNYRIKFDVSLGLEEIWVDSQTLDYLNNFRENIFVSSGFPISAALPAAPCREPSQSQQQAHQATRNQPKRQSKQHQSAGNHAQSSNDTKSTAASNHQQGKQSHPSNDDSRFGYCHQCKQLKKLELLAECKYDSDRMGHQSPISYTVSDVTIFNVDMTNTSSLTHLVLKEMQLAESKQPRTSADIQNANLQNRSFQALVPNLLKLDAEKYRHMNLRRHLQLCQKPQYKCNRKFCHACLKLCYDDDFNVCKNNRSWICHFCYGVCSCTRCLNQDIITQIKAYYISMGGSLQSIQAFSSHSQLDKMIYNNFQTHLWLTLLSNTWLLSKYPTFRHCINEGGDQALLGDSAQATNFFKEDPNCQKSDRESCSQTRIAEVKKKKAGGPVANEKQIMKFSRLLEYSVLAQASEDPKHQVSLAEITKKQTTNSKRKPSEGAILQAIQSNSAAMLTNKGRNSNLSNKKIRQDQDLNLIRSDGTKRKFFFRDGEVRRNLNKRQQKLVQKAQKARSSFALQMISS